MPNKKHSDRLRDVCGTIVGGALENNCGFPVDVQPEDKFGIQRACHSMVPPSTPLLLSEKLQGWQEQRCSDDQKAFRVGNSWKVEKAKNDMFVQLLKNNRSSLKAPLSSR